MSTLNHSAKSGPDTQRRRRRGPRRATPEYLRKSALHYLDRYATSSAHLRRLLLRKVERSAKVHETDAVAGAEAIDALIGDFLRMGLLNDGEYAASRARILHRRGLSTRGIRAALAAKGLMPEVAHDAIAGLEDMAADPDLIAAAAYARRRKLGPYRPPEARTDARTRDLAALGRRGFSYDIAARVIDAATVEALEALKDEPGTDDCR